MWSQTPTGRISPNPASAAYTSPGFCIGKIQTELHKEHPGFFRQEVWFLL